jgi:hypothetical protein
MKISQMIREAALSKSEIARRLKKHRIKTMKDLDAWIKKNPKKDKHGGYFLSRFKALAEILQSEDSAHLMLNELSLQQAPVPKKR